MSIYYLTPDQIISMVNENPSGYHMLIKYQHSIFYKHIMSNYVGKNIAERLYRYCYPNNVPVCATCGSLNVKFIEFTTGYRKYCSRYCTSHSDACRSGKLAYQHDEHKKTVAIKKTKETNIKKYGVEHWMLTDEGKQQNSESNKRFWHSKFPRYKNGRTRKQYVAAARHLTNCVYKEMSTIIDPFSLRSKDMVLDHIFSLSDGFDNDVPLDVICHWTNLRIIPKSHNSSKGPISDISLTKLYELYNQADPTSSTPVSWSK